MIILQSGNGKTLTTRHEIARGGEGTIYTIREDSRYLVKLFHQPTSEKTAKLRAMLAHPPVDLTLKTLGHISIAWPRDLVFCDQRRDICAGFLMPYIHAINAKNSKNESFPLLKLYNPRDRLQTDLNWTWEYLLYMACNLSSAVKELHSKGYVIGDLNESNILVTPEALVTLVDCDSMQVPQKRGWMLPWQRKYFRCTVGKAEYTAPELQHRDFSQVNRKKRHDDFSLAILIFLMLMEGRHPFASAGTPLTLEQGIQSGQFPYSPQSQRKIPRYALPFNTLPPKLQKLMLRCFVTSYRFALAWRRPTTKQWYRALLKVQEELADCHKNPQHVYSQYLPHCLWCERVGLGIPDSFPRRGAPPAKRSRRKIQAPERRVQLQRLARLSLPIFTLAFYIVEIAGWHFYMQYTQYTQHNQHAQNIDVNLLRIECILGLVFFFLPLIVHIILYRKLKAS